MSEVRVFATKLGDLSSNLQLPQEDEGKSVPTAADRSPQTDRAMNISIHITCDTNFQNFYGCPTSCNPTEAQGIFSFLSRRLKEPGHQLHIDIFY